MRLHGTLLTLAATIASAAAFGPHDIKNIVTFGDSLSDNGNSLKDFGVPQAPYFNGHWSNGPIWIEYLSKFLDNATVYDYAVGGAVANKTDAPATDSLIPDLAVQISVFQQDAVRKQLSPSSTLYTVWAGGNDFDDAAATGKVPDPAAIAGYVLTAVDALVKLGATNILVCNLPPLDLTPSGIALGPVFGPILDALSNAFDTALRAGLTDMGTANPGANLVLNDVAKVFYYATSAEGEKDFGLTDSSHPCLNTTSKVACADPEKYLFWDGVHPTTTVHNHIAQWAYNQLFNISGFDASPDVVNPPSTSTASSVAASSTNAASSVAASSTIASSGASISATSVVVSGSTTVSVVATSSVATSNVASASTASSMSLYQSSGVKGATSLALVALGFAALV
ncbi:GDSL-like Lipase/Acylhydrolase-domain-containing protein [Chytriomyces sp. MP71]|nr:GDSL-like Lipase/Acylhydrolase-domain-containing protein [Chytriomyces sp. MP71]